MTIETIGFDHFNRIRMVFERGALERLGELARELGGSRALLVTDPGLMQAGHPARAEESLRAAGLTVSVFSQAEENPTTRCVDQCAAAAREHDADILIGLGGGSSLDAAKGCNFIFTNGGFMKDYWGVGKAAKPMLPMIAVPTTAGTGSECQSFALISDAETHMKMACGDPKAAPRVSILDPELTLTQPPAVTARTGMDAISHAVETAVTKKRNSISWLYSREAFRLLNACFKQVLKNPDDIQARSGMLLGAAYSGIAIENSMLGGAHALANPLTAAHDVIHGQAVGMMLPHIVRFNARDEKVKSLYKEFAVYAGVADAMDSESACVEALAKRLTELLRAAGMAATLSELNIENPDLKTLAAGAAKQWTGNFNPVELNEGAFEEIYSNVLG